MSVASFHGRVAALSRSRADDDPDLLNARRDLAAANIAACIERALATAPALTDEQAESLAALFQGDES